MKILSKNVEAGATVDFDVANLSNAIILMQAGYNQTAYSIFSSSGLGNVVVSSGAAVNVGNTSDPGSGTFRIWSSASRKLSVKMNPLERRIDALKTLIDLPQSTSKAIPYSEWPAPPQVHLETDEAKVFENLFYATT